MTRRVLVVGGGVAGLAITLEIAERLKIAPTAAGGEKPSDSIELLCLEAAGRPGGNIRTDREEGYTVEWGPNGFLDNVPATLDLVRRVGLASRLLRADPSAGDRFIFRSGSLRKLPGGPASFLFSSVLSLRGRLRVLCEPFGPGPRGKEDESVHDFAVRRIGEEAARVLVGAMVTGVYAGDARILSLRATFPKMYRMEREHGTLTRAMLRKMKERRARERKARGRKAEGGQEAEARAAKAGGPAGPGGTLTSFQGGLQELIDALARAVGPALRTGARVTRVVRLATGGGAQGLPPSDPAERSKALEGVASATGNRYRVEIEGGETIDASAVVLACPAWEAAEATAALDPDLSSTLARIRPASLAVVHLGYAESDLPWRPDGFGFLVPREEGPRILGTIWASSIFPGRAPPGHVLLTTMVGGAHDPAAIGLDDGELVGVVRNDLRRVMGIDAPPAFVRIFRHPRGIPQYELGHPARLEAIDRRLAELPGILVAGDSYRGIAVNSCADEAPRIAEAALR